jgi:DNA-binding transcriptional LysR family regulator
VTEDHQLATEAEIAVEALANDGFVMFPREFAPRLYESLVGICRRAGFEPTIRSESFHTSWELGVLADVPVVALVPESVARGMPAGLVALVLKEPVDRIDTAIVWRKDDASAVGAAFREVAGTVFEVERLGS